MPRHSLTSAYTEGIALCHTHWMDQRTDRLTAVLVDLTVNIVGVYGMVAGVVSLHECGAPLPVIQRALIERGPRRGVINKGVLGKH